MTVDIVPASPANWDALASLFREGGDPGMCWCQFWRLRSKDMSARHVPELRERLHAQVEGGAAGDGEPPGLVALDTDGRALGWVSLGPRDAYERVTHSRVIPKIDDRPVWSIVCFAVSSTARGRGVARDLLGAAIDFARAQGAIAVEAYPKRVEPGERIHPDAAYMGTLPMFERAGFSVVADKASDPSSAHTRVVVRLELGSAG
jgi:GNAT superfamily N-acetyltransferase